MENCKHWIFIVFITIFGIIVIACDNDNNNHMHNLGTWSITLEPTCIAAGIKELHCNSCNDLLDTEIIPINNNAHVWDEWDGETIYTFPTCIETGVGTIFCSLNIQHTKTGIIPKLGHDFIDNWSVIIVATCENSGEKERNCTRDNCHEIEKISINALGHEWEWVSSATITEDGFETGTCKYNSSHIVIQNAYATGTTGLEYFLINNNSEYSVRRGSVISGEVYIPTYYRSNADSEYLPVTEIGGGNSNSSFYNISINAIYFLSPSNITKINNYAFEACHSIIQIVFPTGLIYIGDNAFNYCTNLEQVTFPTGLTYIGDNAFNGTKIDQIVLPNELITINNYAFNWCKSLICVTSLAEIPPTLGLGVFNNTHSNLVINVPANSVETYKTAVGWSVYADKIEEIK